MAKALEVATIQAKEREDEKHKEEIAAKEQKEGKIAASQVFDEEEISRNRPMDIPEFNDEDDLPAEERTGKKSTSAANDVLDDE